MYRAKILNLMTVEKMDQWFIQATCLGFDPRIQTCVFQMIVLRLGVFMHVTLMFVKHVWMSFILKRKEIWGIMMTHKIIFHPRVFYVVSRF